MSSPNLLTPPTTVDPQTALLLSQKAPPVLSRSPTSSLPWPLSLLFSSETPETWATYENLVYAALRTGDEKSARQLLDRMTERFGESNERILALRGLYDEAVAKDNAQLTQVFDTYGQVLEQDPTNFPIRKRRIAVLKALGRTQEAIMALTVLLENSPIDAEAWAELSDLYAQQGLWAQAIYCLEEVLLIMPNAWSAHAQIATLHFLSSPQPSLIPYALALKHFSRSIELNESYLRGFYGLKLVCAKLIPLLSSTSGKAHSDNEVKIPKLQTVQKLEELATKKLGEIIRNSSSGKTGWTAFDKAEVIAARELLDRDDQTVR